MGTNEQEQMLQTRAFVESLNHANDIGLRLTHFEAGRAEMILPYNERLIGDPVSKVISGGAVSALMDTCCGAAVMSHPKNNSHTATLNLRIDYTRSAHPGEDITAHAHCYHISRTVAFVRAVAYDNDQTSPVAHATGNFIVEADQ